MSDTQLMTLCLSIIIPLSMLLYSNSRITEAKKDIEKAMDALKETLRAEMETLRSEIRTLNVELGAKIDNAVERA